MCYKCTFTTKNFTFAICFLPILSTDYKLTRAKIAKVTSNLIIFHNFSVFNSEFNGIFAAFNETPKYFRGFVYNVGKGFISIPEVCKASSNSQ